MASASQQEKQPPARPPPPRVTSPPQSSRPSLVDSEIHSFQDLQRVHDAAYQFIDSGLREDEGGNGQLAIESYNQGLQLLNKALRINVEKLTHSTLDQMEAAKEIQMKMNKTKQQITYRLQALQPALSDLQERMEADAPPSYEYAISQPSSPPSYEDEELAALGESLMRRELSNSLLANANELFTIPDGVQIFYISPEGYVSAPSYPTSLHIIKIDDPQAQGPNGEIAPAFIHVGDWMYPLVPGRSPALHTNYGAYLFPDTFAAPGSAVGLIVPDDLDPGIRQELEQIISSLTALVQEPEEQPAEAVEPQDMAGRISKHITAAADFIAWGLTKGAEKAGRLIQAGSEKIQKNTEKCSKPHPVDPKLQKGVVYARQATHGAVQVTGYVVKKLGEVTMQLGREIAPHIKKHCKHCLPKSLSEEKASGRSTLDGITDVAATSLKGFGTVYIGLETAARSLGRCLVSETTQVVNHKFGEEAAGFTENTMYAAGNVVLTSHNVHNLGMKAIAKRAVKDTGRALLEEGRNAPEENGKAAGSVDKEKV
ncbi:spartin-like [Physella acuta]|uniref:spartin-like n=1 Tax=Physella acuta TaxID=109671 RepID=UPI0027DD9A17|nr:spartin-like [Physella acuta]